MSSSRGALRAALALSLLIHVIPLSVRPLREWWADQTPITTDIQETSVSVEAVALAAPTPSAPRGLSLTFYRPPPVSPNAPPAPVVPVPEPRAADAPKRPEPLDTAVAETPPTEASPGLPPEAADDPAPTFPVRVDAQHVARYLGLTLRLQQTWFLEGNRYFIQNDAKKFGFRGQINSEGRFDASGLLPERFALLLNNRVQTAATVNASRTLMTHGRPGRERQTPLTEAGIQDMASLAFHVAVSYRGTETVRIPVTTGRSVYVVELRPIAKERLTLPGGTLDTIHLQGRRVREDGSEQSGYDIWLAPALRNYPVRFRGPDSRGDILDMSLSAMNLEGTVVFGRDADRVIEDTESVPDSVRDALLRQSELVPPADSAPQAPDTLEQILDQPVETSP